MWVRTGPSCEKHMIHGQLFSAQSPIASCLARAEAAAQLLEPFEALRLCLPLDLRSDTLPSILDVLAELLHGGHQLQLLLLGPLAAVGRRSGQRVGGGGARRAVPAAIHAVGCCSPVDGRCGLAVGCRCRCCKVDVDVGEHLVASGGLRVDIRLVALASQLERGIGLGRPCTPPQAVLGHVDDLRLGAGAHRRSYLRPPLSCAHGEFDERLLQQPLLVGGPGRHAGIAAGGLLLPGSCRLGNEGFLSRLLGNLLRADLLPNQCLILPQESLLVCAVAIRCLEVLSEGRELHQRQLLAQLLRLVVAQQPPILCIAAHVADLAALLLHGLALHLARLLLLGC
mmetsp:Transcript_17038/g.50860  ORF Transcript_17038/g.50860 Transcript_17038/m.50860 type:complete len:340 (-) Transcript_17038:1064-2083(-)